MTTQLKRERDRERERERVRVSFVLRDLEFR